MSGPTDQDDELNGQVSGRGESDKSGKAETGGAGAGTSRVQPLSTAKNKEVWSVLRKLVGDDLAEAVVEFFSDAPMRAAANLNVTWEKTKANVSAKSFAIVNWIIEFGDTTVRELARTRERTRGAARDSRGLIQRQKPRPAGMTVTPGPAGPTGIR